MTRQVKLKLPSQDVQSSNLDSQSPIFNLDQGILWRIFSILAHIKGNDNNPRALISLRRLSQVSTSWRELILASPSLWGRVIDFACLQQPSDDWRIEVLRRTDNSPLYIQAWLGHGDSRLEAFLALILEKQWTRIRWLNIGLGRSCPLAEDAMWRTFQTPAPQLEHYSVVLERPPPRSLLATIGLNMFGNHAPLIKHFASADFKIRGLHSNWLTDIRNLHFTCHFAAPEFLDVLSQMPFLETLEVFTDAEEAEMPVIGKNMLQTVTLPHLKDFGVNTGQAMNKYLAVLEHLVLPAVCEFRFQTGVAALVQSNLVAAQRVLHSYFELCFKHFSPYDLILEMDKRNFNLSACGFSFSFGLEFDRDIPDPCMFLKGLGSSSVPLEDIIRCSIVISGHNLPPNDANFSQTLALLSSVEELEVNPNALRFLSPMLTEGDVIPMPALRELVISEFDNLDPDVLLDFFALRHTVNAPIQVLDLTKDRECRLKLYNLGPLDQVPGLRVVWFSGSRRQEYFCGDGNSFALDFKDNS
ncbi:hypothetical protein GALMADRAFT_249525 [Galerina marginata CBS 339.88]|uniref:Uncharacterized protein n=1 Tax=Galerina marginata (strain CBS 339.88) TaxID=685588 RepID=A0A067SUQ4_GALM3|nr:hypothetical protein GALMADRAFT_249525 [Galerina marginata CBS 339.88]